MNVFTFGRAPVSIEILKEISGISFQEVYKNALDVSIEGLSVRVINLRDLKINKKHLAGLKIQMILKICRKTANNF